MHLGYFWLKSRHKEFSKIAQSGHTDCDGGSNRKVYAFRNELHHWVWHQIATSLIKDLIYKLYSPKASFLSIWSIKSYCLLKTNELNKPNLDPWVWPRSLRCSREEDCQLVEAENRKFRSRLNLPIPQWAYLSIVVELKQVCLICIILQKCPILSKVFSVKSDHKFEFGPSSAFSVYSSNNLASRPKTHTHIFPIKSLLL